MHELKYYRGLHVLADLETLARESAYVMDFVRGSVLVPVPLHPRKERQRGSNLAALLAALFARAARRGHRASPDHPVVPPPHPIASISAS